ncbi:MAG TPA: ABC transporter substrate-binding protein [Spirochaetota bacterium]|nr:ABC transporter substrate-binding protein [Spirochaetota bacterium]
MITLKTPARAVLIVITLSAVIFTLTLYGALGNGNGVQRPVITPELPFSPPPDPSAPFRVAIYPCGGFAPGLLANGGLKTTKGSIYDKDFGLNVEFIMMEDPSRCARLLGVPGGPDIAWSTLPVLTFHQAKNCGSNPVVIMQYDTSRGGDAIFSSHPYRSLDELKGKRLPCVEGGNAHFVILFLLHTAGIEPSALNWEFTATDSDAMLLLKKGRTDVCGISTYGIPVPPSLKLLFSTVQASRLVPGVFITREDLLLRKREQARKFIAGWFRGVSEMQKNRDAAVKIMATAYGCDENKSIELLKSSILAGYRDNVEFFSIGQHNRTGFDFLVDVSLSRWKGISGSLMASCAGLKHTDALVAAASDVGKAVAGYDSGIPESMKNPSLESLSREYLLDFPAYEYTPGFKSSMVLDRFVTTASIFQGSNIDLYGNAGTPGEQAYSYNWGMRFYIVGKALTDAGIPKEKVTIKEIRLDTALAGAQKHTVGCVIRR